MIRKLFSQPSSYKDGKQIIDGLTLVNIIEQTLIEIKYDPIEQIFKPIMLEQNQDDEENNKLQDQANS